MARAEVAAHSPVHAELRGAQRELLFHLASRFRRAILSTDLPNCSLPSLSDFPHGACHDASLLLAKYLQVNGCGDAYYVLGERGGVRHAWLELQGFVLDITADQFADQPAGVIVTGESAWHAAFNGHIHNTADFCLYDPRSAFKLTRAYHLITGRLRS